MGEESTSRTVSERAVIVAIGLIVFYLLSPGPLVWYLERGSGVPDWLETGLEVFFKPLETLYSHSSAVKWAYDGYFRLFGLNP